MNKKDTINLILAVALNKFYIRKEPPNSAMN